MIHRTLCDCLEEMRQVLKMAKPFPGCAVLTLLIEEIQVYANRMEAGLYYHSDLEILYTKRKKLKKEVDALKAEKKTLEPKEKEEGEKDELTSGRFSRQFGFYDEDDLIDDLFDQDELVAWLDDKDEDTIEEGPKE